MSAVLVMGIHRREESKCRALRSKEGVCWGRRVRAEQSPLEQSKENRAQSKNVVRAERSCWCLLFLCHTAVPREKGNGSIYV